MGDTLDVALGWSVKQAFASPFLPQRCIFMLDGDSRSAANDSLAPGTPNPSPNYMSDSSAAIDTSVLHGNCIDWLGNNISNRSVLFYDGSFSGDNFSEYRTMWTDRGFSTGTWTYGALQTSNWVADQMANYGAVVFTGSETEWTNLSGTFYLEDALWRYVTLYGGRLFGYLPNRWSNNGPGAYARCQAFMALMGITLSGAWSADIRMSFWSKISTGLDIGLITGVNDHYSIRISSPAFTAWDEATTAMYATKEAEAYWRGDAWCYRAKGSNIGYLAAWEPNGIRL